MPDVLTALVDAASARGATYADARSVEREHEAVSLRDGQVEGVTRTADRGVGFRVIHQGAWGFAATDRTGEAAMRGLVDEAFARAAASASTRSKPVALAPIAPQGGEYRTTLTRDPFAVPMKERIALLTAADAALTGPNAKSRRASVAAYRTRKRLVTSEGTDVTQEVVESGAGVAVTAAKGGARPAQRYDSRLTRQAGWEFVEELDLVARAARYREDAEATLDAPLATERPTTLVFAPEFLALLVHESCGHPTEADRVLEYEVAFAGTTFMWPKDRGQLRYGSEHINMTADATVPGGMGTFGWDD
ncbi:MAG TPA: TldD/PmbA family protein, partial [Candidatus Acidoferrales bacterium]|nr:TldD/PmbA family protein [Candidatus Acidoferrales bacterium]